MERAFRTSFPYVDRREDFVNRCEIGVQGSRPAEVLKLWLTLHHVGWRCHGELVDRWVGLADAVAAEVRRRSYLTLACAPRSGIVCFRGVPDWMAVEDHDAWTAALHAVIATDTGIRLSLVPYCGARWMRAVFANPFVERSVVDRLFVAIDGHATKRPCAV